jgi:hypothetical protein
MKRIINTPTFEYTTYDSKNPFDMAYSIMDDNDGESILTIKRIAFEMWDYCNEFGRKVLKALELFEGSRGDINTPHNTKFYTEFDNWCVNNNIKVYDKCKKCGKEIYVFDMWGTRKDLTGLCYKCEQDNKVMIE